MSRPFFPKGEVMPKSLRHQAVRFVRRVLLLLAVVPAVFLACCLLLVLAEAWIVLGVLGALVVGVAGMTPGGLDLLTETFVALTGFVGRAARALWRWVEAEDVD